MSLPDEYIRAQESIILYFMEDKMDRKLWPKHLMNGTEMKMLYDEIEELREQNQELREVIKAISSAIVEYEQDVEEITKGNKR
jgi:nicotinamidase-related amidase